MAEQDPHPRYRAERLRQRLAEEAQLGVDVAVTDAEVVLRGSVSGEAVDRAGADLALHGHAHRGSEEGTTVGGVRVRNVAQPVIGQAYRVFHLEPVAAPRPDACRA